MMKRVMIGLVLQTITATVLCVKYNIISDELCERKKNTRKTIKLARINVVGKCLEKQRAFLVGVCPRGSSGHKLVRYYNIPVGCLIF